MRPVCGFMISSKGTALKRPCCTDTSAFEPALEDELRGVVPEVTRVLYVERDRIRAPDFVADVLRDHRRLQAERRQPRADRVLAHIAEAHFVDPDVPVLVTLHRGKAFQVLRRDRLHEPFGQDGDAVGAARGEAASGWIRRGCRRSSSSEVACSRTPPGSRSTSRPTPCRCLGPGARLCGPSPRRSTSGAWSSRRPSGCGRCRRPRAARSGSRRSGLRAAGRGRCRWSSGRGRRGSTSPAASASFEAE